MNNNLRMMLGYLGFLPFGFLTILPWIIGEEFTFQSYFLLTVYGAIILSFLAGMSWGWNISNKKNLFIGISFSLISFFFNNYWLFLFRNCISYFCNNFSVILYF